LLQRIYRSANGGYKLAKSVRQRNSSDEISCGYPPTPVEKTFIFNVSDRLSALSCLPKRYFSLLKIRISIWFDFLTSGYQIYLRRGRRSEQMGLINHYLCSILPP
jgi:hypothetical protein